MPAESQDMDYKELGYWGSFFLVLGIIPIAGTVLSIVGFVMVTIAYKRAARELGREEIWKYYLYYLILIFLAIPLIALMVLFMENSEVLFGILVAIAAVAILGANYYKKSLYALSEATGEGDFRTAGNLYFWGAILTVVLVGAIIMYIGNIFLFMGFRSLRRSESS